MKNHFKDLLVTLRRAIYSRNWESPEPEERAEVTRQLLQELGEKRELFAQTAEGETFLHQLLGERGLVDECPSEVKDFILGVEPRAILKEYSKLVPLAECIKKRDEVMVEKMVKIMEEKGLMLDDGGEEAGKQCIQEAFDFHGSRQHLMPLSIDLIERLIGLATPIMLKTRAPSLIPLHQAVHYDVCVRLHDRQLGLVKKLLDKCEDSILEIVGSRTRMKSMSQKEDMTEEDYSVYRWHIFTRDKYRAGASQMAMPPPGTRLQRTSSMLPQANGVPSAKSSDIFRSKNVANVVEIRPSEKDGDSPKEEEKEGMEIGPRNNPRTAGNAPSDAAPTPQDALYLAEAASKAVLEELTLRFLRSTFPPPREVASETPHDGRETDDVNTAEKKQHAQDGSGKSAIDTETFFGQQNHVYHFTLEMKRQYQDMEVDMFRAYLNDVKYCPTLRLVILPEVRVQMPSRKPRKIYTDQLFFLRWLREDKGVKKILKLVVDDSKVPHKDEDIEQILIGPDKDGKSRSFNVEILDWRKLDLCPVVIYDAAQHVRELHLQWSGSNSVLRGWSEPDGLPKLPLLQRVHLHFMLPGSHKTRIGKNITVFKSRLEAGRRLWKSKSPPVGEYPDVAVYKEGLYYIDDENSTPGQNPAKPTDRQPENPWFKYVREFVDLVPDIPAAMKSKPAMGNVTVALIDDGVDVFSKSLGKLQDRIRPGASFDTSKDGPAPEHASAGGHGTVMAQAILRMCPCATIVPIRLMTQPDVESYVPRPVPSSAAKAIREAIRRDVDVISMSWTIRSKDGADFKRGMDDLKSVIESLPRNTRIPLMFCAASDDGRQREDRAEDYPRAMYPRGMFCIGAADSNSGEAWPLVTDQKDLQYLFPGVDIHMVTEDALDQAQRDALTVSGKTGSSIATAFAAGLAALLIHCTKLGLYHMQAMRERKLDPQETLRLDLLRDIRSFRTMKFALDQLTVKNASNQAFANPRDAFQKATKELRVYERNRGVDLNIPESLGPIATLVRDLCQSRY